MLITHKKDADYQAGMFTFHGAHSAKRRKDKSMHYTSVMDWKIFSWVNDSRQGDPKVKFDFTNGLRMI